MGESGGGFSVNRNQLRRYIVQEIECTMVDHNLQCVSRESTLNKLRSLHFTIKVNWDDCDELSQQVEELIKEVECT